MLTEMGAYGIVALAVRLANPLSLTLFFSFEEENMKHRRYVVLALLVLLSMAAGLIGCAPVAPKDKEINVLCTPQEEWCQGMKQEFEKKYGITVNYVRMSSGEALARLQAEKDNPQFDIWWGGPIDSFVAAKKEGLLEPYNSPNLKNLLDQDKYKDEDNTWAGIYVGSLGFCTNKDWLAKNPSVKAPTRGMICSSPSSRARSWWPIHPPPARPTPPWPPSCRSMGEEKGWEYIKKYAGQISQFTKSGAAPAKFVGQGEAAVCIVFSHDIVNEIDNNKMPLELTFPEEGTGYEIGGMGIVKGAKHLDAAKMWFDWALTPRRRRSAPSTRPTRRRRSRASSSRTPSCSRSTLINYDFQWAGDNKKAIRRQVHQRDRRRRQAEVVVRR